MMKLNQLLTWVRKYENFNPKYYQIQVRTEFVENGKFWHMNGLRKVLWWNNQIFIRGYSQKFILGDQIQFLLGPDNCTQDSNTTIIHQKINIKVKMTKIVFLDMWSHHLQPLENNSQNKNGVIYVKKCGRNQT